MKNNENQLHGLPSKHVLNLKNIFSQYPINQVILYGSRAMGNFRYNSDIDITLIAPQLNLSHLMEIQNKIEDLLIPYKVDLSLFHQIQNQNLKKHIQEVGITF